MKDLPKKQNKNSDVKKANPLITQNRGQRGAGWVGRNTG